MLIDRIEIHPSLNTKKVCRAYSMSYESQEIFQSIHRLDNKCT
jgi:hypothetical protein